MTTDGSSAADTAGASVGAQASASALVAALRIAGERFHDIASTLTARTMLADSSRALTAPLREEMERRASRDPRTMALEGFEAVALALLAAGDPTVSVHSCSADDIAAPPTPDREVGLLHGADVTWNEATGTQTVRTSGMRFPLQGELTRDQAIAAMRLLAHDFETRYEVLELNPITLSIGPGTEVVFRERVAETEEEERRDEHPAESDRVEQAIADAEQAADDAAEQAAYRIHATDGYYLASVERHLWPHAEEFELRDDAIAYALDVLAPEHFGPALTQPSNECTSTTTPFRVYTGRIQRFTRAQLAGLAVDVTWMMDQLRECLHEEVGRSADVDLDATEEQLDDLEHRLKSTFALWLDDHNLDAPCYRIVSQTEHPYLRCTAEKYGVQCQLRARHGGFHESKGQRDARWPQDESESKDG